MYEATSFAEKIGYTGAPIKKVITDRLDALEKCIADHENSQKDLKVNENGLFDSEETRFEELNKIL